MSRPRELRLAFFLARSPGLERADKVEVKLQSPPEPAGALSLVSSLKLDSEIPPATIILRLKKQVFAPRLFRGAQRAFESLLKRFPEFGPTAEVFIRAEQERETRQRDLWYHFYDPQGGHAAFHAARILEGDIHTLP